MVGCGAIVAAAGRWLFGLQRADCEGQGVLRECTVFIVILTEALTILAGFLNVCPGSMYHIMLRWAKPALLSAPHVGHQTITVSLETLWVVNLGIVNVHVLKVLDGILYTDVHDQSWS